MLVMPPSGSIRNSAPKSTGLRLARSLSARRPAGPSSAFCDDGMPQRIMQSSRMPPRLATTGA